MKQILILITLVLATFTAYADTPAGATITAATAMEQITARIVVKIVKGIPVPQVDPEIFKYVTSSVFVYNRNKTKALMIMEVKAENSAAVRALLEKKKALVNTDDTDRLDREYRGFKKRFKKAALK